MFRLLSIVMKMSKHVINLTDAAINGATLELNLDEKFFSEMQKDVEGGISHGNVRAVADCRKVNDEQFIFNIHAEGNVFVPCDRCLDDVELRIDTNQKIIVKIGDEDIDEGDIYVVDRKNPILNIALVVYQFVVISIPIRRVHLPGMCNEAMMNKLRIHQVARSDDGMTDNDNEEENIVGDTSHYDQRWDKLRTLLNK